MYYYEIVAFPPARFRGQLERVGVAQFALVEGGENGASRPIQAE